MLCIGNVYIADSNNSRIRKVTISTGIIATIAGTGSHTFSGDSGPASSAALYYSTGVALDTSGRVITTIEPFHNVLFNTSIYRQRVHR